MKGCSIENEAARQAAPRGSSGGARPEDGRGLRQDGGQNVLTYLSRLRAFCLAFLVRSHPPAEPSGRGFGQGCGRGGRDGTDAENFRRI